MEFKYQKREVNAKLHISFDLIKFPVKSNRRHGNRVQRHYCKYGIDWVLGLGVPKHYQHSPSNTYHHRSIFISAGFIFTQTNGFHENCGTIVTTSFVLHYIVGVYIQHCVHTFHVKTFNWYVL